jgi:hypothetical protein
MHVELTCHPDSPSAAARQVLVEIRRDCDILQIDFRVAGGLAALNVPARTVPRRTDGLWRHTCFELFVRPGGGSAYFEYNLSPSTAWAAYRFDDYRSGMMDAEVAPPKIEPTLSCAAVELSVSLRLPSRAPAGRLGLSAVLEETDGTRSYWALAHPPGAPDFHHPDCFALDIPAPDAA